MFSIRLSISSHTRAQRIRDNKSRACVIGRDLYRSLGGQSFTRQLELTRGRHPLPTARNVPTLRQLTARCKAVFTTTIRPLFDSYLTAVRPRYDHSTTYVTTYSGMLHCGLNK